MALVPNLNVRPGRLKISDPDIHEVETQVWQPPLTFMFGTNGVNNFQLPLTFMLGTNGVS